MVIGNDTTPSIPGSYNPSKARNTMATFKITNVDQLKEQAYAKAVQDAKTQAEKLARLTGVKLGKVISINGEGDSNKSANAVYNQMMAQYIAAGIAIQSDEQASSLFKAIPVSVAVRVTFSIE